MAIIYGKKTAVDYAAGNLASFGKSYSRMGAAPLDMTEVWYDKAALEEYAAYRGVEQADGSYDTSSVTSYVGQRVVFVDETAKKVYNYSIQLDGSLKEIGTSPVGDGKSIAVATNGTVSLKGINGLVFEREVDVLDENGEPTGEKKTEEVKYQPLMTKAGLTWIEPSKTTVEGLALLIEALSTDVKALETKVGKAAEGENDATGLFKAIADEAKARDDADKALDAKIGAASVPETTEGAGDGKAATGVYVAIEAEAARAKAAEEALDGRVDILEDWKNNFEDKDTTYTVKEGDKVLSLTGTEFSTQIGLSYTDNRISLTGINGEEIAGFDASAFVADGVLEDVAYDAETKDLTFTWNVMVKDEEGKDVKKTDTVNIADLIDTYTAGNGLDLANNEFSVKLAADSESFLTVGANGVKLAGVQDAINTAEQNAKGYADGLADNYDASGAAAQALKDAKDYADGLASNYDAVGSAADAEKNAKDYADTELAKKVDKVAGYGLLSEADQAKLNKLTLDDGELSISGSVEAGSVKNLDTWIGTNRDTVAGLYPTADANKLAGIEAGAQVNVIESVVASSTAKITATKSGKEVTIDDTALVSLINNAQKDATQGITDAAEAKGIAEGAVKDAATNANLISGLDARLTAAEGVGNTNTGAIAGHETRLAAAETAITAINSTSLPAKADKSVVDGLSTTVGEHTTALSNLNTNTIPALQAAIDGKAASADLTAEINRATGKENELAGLIATISGDYLKAADKTALENAIAAEVKTARAAEKKNADDIAAINTLLNTVDSEDSITSLKELAIWVEAHGSEASEMTKAIEKNAEDIAANTKKIGEVEASIPGALATALADYKVKNVDGTTLQLSETGVASIKAVSTDLLVQGTLELILNGGSAN